MQHSSSLRCGEDRSQLMSYGTAPRGSRVVLMTVQSLAFGGYKLGAAEL